MIFSKLSKLSDAQAITATADSTNTIDFGPTGTVAYAAAALTRDQGKGEKIPLDIQVVADFNDLTSLEVQWQESDDNQNWDVVDTTGAILLAALVAGYQFSMDRIPLGATKRYGKIHYVVVGTAPTTGAVTAGVTMGNQTASV